MGNELKLQSLDELAEILTYEMRQHRFVQPSYQHKPVFSVSDDAVLPVGVFDGAKTKEIRQWFSLPSNRKLFLYRRPRESHDLKYLGPRASVLKLYRFEATVTSAVTHIGIHGIFKLPRARQPIPRNLEQELGEVSTDDDNSIGDPRNGLTAY